MFPKKPCLAKAKNLFFPWMNFTWLQIFSGMSVDLSLDTNFKRNHFNCPQTGNERPAHTSLCQRHDSLLWGQRHICSFGDGVQSSREPMETGKGALKLATELAKGKEKGDSVWLGRGKPQAGTRQDTAKGVKQKAVSHGGRGHAGEREEDEAFLTTSLRTARRTPNCREEVES